MRTALLPGVRVAAAPMPLGEPLPRMDIALFAGFASAGPVHCAVSVDSPAAFVAVFGPDPVLAWDAARGKPVAAALGPAVRAFFENGGRRAQVIRLCRTAAHEALWQGGDPDLVAAAGGVATVNRFPVPGVLSLSPGGGLSPAMALARSVGSWSDGLALRARCVRQGFRLAMRDQADGQVRFEAEAGLRAGDLVELGDDTGARRTYLRIARIAGGRAEAVFLAGFTRIADAAEGEGMVAVAGETRTARLGRAATGRPELTLLAPFPVPLARAQWLRWTAPGRVDLWFDTASAGPWAIAGTNLPQVACWQTDLAASLDATNAARLTLDLAVDSADGLTERRFGLGLTPGAEGSWWQEACDDETYRPGDAARERPSLVRENVALPVAWLPLGLAQTFGPPLGALPQVADPLVRDGLARFDAELFLDPRLARSGIPTLVSQAEALQAEHAEPLHGIHALLAVPPAERTGELPSIVAIPDAVHPGWSLRADDAPSLPPDAAVVAPAHWSDHRRACAPATTLAFPAHERFLDCATRLLAKSHLVLPPGVVAPGVQTLSWTASEPGASYVVEESARADMAGAVEVGRTGTTALRIDMPREGDYYVRVTAHLDSEQSLPSVGLIRVRASAYEISGRDDAAADRAVLHRALLRLAAAEGGLFALLSLPQSADVPAAREAARMLTAERGSGSPDGFAEGERYALSHGSLLHGWLEQAGTPARKGLAPPLSPVPPCGAVAGVMARRALEGGAWLSPAGQPIWGAAALAAPLRDPALVALISDRAMPLREVPGAFVLADAHTLADDDAWRPIGTRRLFALLRRYLLARGAAYAFEPNDAVLKRTIERSLSEALLTLYRAGAFAGARPSEGFRVTVDPRETDRAAGRIVAEIAVAPSRPLAFLNVVLRQLGERLTFEESV